MSPAKLALRRHLSQERLSTHTITPERSLSAFEARQAAAAAAAMEREFHPPPSASSNNNPSGLLGTRTIGDLVSGEIERTLEISNQTIINAAVDMSSMIRPETVYSPISRPASTEGDTGLATLAHVASYAPTPAAVDNAPPPTSNARSSVLFTPVTASQAQRYVSFFLLNNNLDFIGE